MDRRSDWSAFFSLGLEELPIILPNRCRSHLDTLSDVALKQRIHETGVLFYRARIGRREAGLTAFAEGHYFQMDQLAVARTMQRAP